MLSKNRLEKLYKSGLSIKRISEIENFPYTTIKYWMKRYNIPRRSRVEACFYGYWGKNKEFSRIPKLLTIDKIKDFYYRKGYSVKEVADLLGYSPKSIYRFMDRNDLKRRSSRDTNNLIFIRKKPSFTIKNDLKLEEEKLKLAGVMLYWAEGAKDLKERDWNTVDFANSDPEMIKIFLKFLRDICGVYEKRLRVQLYCYVDQDINFLKNHWKTTTGISLEQFNRPYIRKDFLPEKKGKMKFGVVHIRYSDKKLFLQIKDWTRQYLNKMLPM
ncbi:MAG: hypothetical protein PHI53_00230 [Candidatus Pacebacteria bacterium]|nr:hypothetical protein [Candidatus Paceibacterota bacterium]